jgi:hypothetical protein
MGGQRARGLFAIVGGSAVATAVAVIVLMSPAPQKINACYLVSSFPGCTPPLGTGSGAGGFHSNVTTSAVMPGDTLAPLPNQIGH